MSREIVYVRPEQPLSAAYQSMLNWKVRHLPVLEGKKLVGILSDRDILLRATQANGQIRVPATPLSEAMTEAPITIGPNSSISKAAELMLEYKIDALPVVEGGELTGLVTSSDLLVLLIGNNDRVDGVKLPFVFQLRHAA